jgi:hypothetical protein
LGGVTGAAFAAFAARFRSFFAALDAVLFFAVFLAFFFAAFGFGVVFSTPPSDDLRTSPTAAAAAATAPARLVHDAVHRRLHAVHDLRGRPVLALHHGSHEAHGEEAAAERQRGLERLLGAGRHGPEA